MFWPNGKFGEGWKNEAELLQKSKINKIENLDWYKDNERNLGQIYEDNMDPDTFGEKWNTYWKQNIKKLGLTITKPYVPNPYSREEANKLFVDYHMTKIALEVNGI